VDKSVIDAILAVAALVLLVLYLKRRSNRKKSQEDL